MWERHPAEMRAALLRHDTILTEAIENAGGHIVRSKGEGDSFFGVFKSASQSIASSLDIQRALTAENWPDPIHVRVRIGMHTGEADLRGGEYYGSAVNRAA